jgi:hypothetical protein
LRKRHEGHIIEETHDPINLVRDGLINQQIDSMIENMVKASIKDMLEDYIVETNYIM